MTVAHAELTGVHLHEPKGIENADSGEVYVADGNGTGVWTPQVVWSLPDKYIGGFTIENSGVDATNDVVLNKGLCRDDSNTEDIILTSGLTKQLDADWVQGNNAGGKDGSTLQNGTWHLFVIKNTSTGVIDALFSISATSPSMPSGFTKKRRVASFLRENGAVRSMSTVELAGGGLEVLVTPTLDVNASTSSVSPITRTLASIPTSIVVDALISGAYVLTATSTPNTSACLISSLGVVDTAPSATGIATVMSSEDAGGSVSPGYFQLAVKTNTLAQIRTRNSSTNTATLYLTTLGWRDSRR